MLQSRLFYEDSVFYVKFRDENSAILTEISFIHVTLFSALYLLTDERRTVLQQDILLERNS
jgi:hypothetical protein